MFGCQQVLIKPDQELQAILEFICGEANKLHNCAVYYGRQMYFKAHQFVRPFDLINKLKRNPHYGALCAQAAQQVCGAVGESIKSYKGLIKLFQEGGLEHRPKLINYREKDGLHLIAYPKQALGKKLLDGQIVIPLGQKVQAWFGLKNFKLAMPANLEYSEIRELRILPRNGCFYAEFVYKVRAIDVTLDPLLALGIDPGLNNWLTIVSNAGTSMIVDGLHLKSLNRWYNKQVSTLKDDKPQGFWSKRLAAITEKRNRQVRDAVNKAARQVVNHCLENHIGTVVFGWNKAQKDSANMGKKTNQKFVQIPTARLKTRIAQLCQQYGIQFVETEESYTSKASFVDADLLPTFGEKPEGWKESGKRTKRGLYRTAQNWYINADCNGAANILRKVSMTLGLDLSRVSRGALTRPTRSHIWVTVQRKSGETRL
ncbi:transposase [Microcoleus sp. bin38.metabat.b11b12b14.051]|uniref:RNA-guided endonuclease InsQ/TnpB family protein n=1 Tax=Microcoleus sp. bin38.metabat.b11b12b14.051 TaxID=2742709 RepID=UPI0025CEFE4C|nr:transposase [Microcoleus sp. bin38.metabat.b11b12b14.051]